jgi:hypothetical protein
VCDGATTGMADGAVSEAGVFLPSVRATTTTPRITAPAAPRTQSRRGTGPVPEDSPSAGAGRPSGGVPDSAARGVAEVGTAASDGWLMFEFGGGRDSASVGVLRAVPHASQKEFSLALSVPQLGHVSGIRHDNPLLGHILGGTGRALPDIR